MIWESEDRIRISGYGTVTAAARTIWPGNSILTLMDGKLRQLSLSSSDVNDTAGGTGAQVIRVYGTDVYNNINEQTIELDGQSPVHLRELLYVHSIDMVSSGSGGTNAGIIYVGEGIVAAGVPATVYDQIPIGLGASQAVRYTVPSGKYLIVEDVIIDADISVVDLTIQLCITNSGNTRIIDHFKDGKPGFRVNSRETLTLRHKDASVAGTVYAHVIGKLQ